MAIQAPGNFSDELRFSKGSYPRVELLVNRKLTVKLDQRVCDSSDEICESHEGISNQEREDLKEDRAALPLKQPIASNSLRVTARMAKTPGPNGSAWLKPDLPPFTELSHLDFLLAPFDHPTVTSDTPTTPPNIRPHTITRQRIAEGPT